MTDNTSIQKYSVETVNSILDKQLQVSKKIVREFINHVFGTGMGDEYKNRTIYDYFQVFNFDLLNYSYKFFARSSEKEISNWCSIPITIRLDEIQKGFIQLTGMRDVRKLEIISNLDDVNFRGTADPDSMKIVCHILFIIYTDVIKHTLNHITQEQADHIIKNKDFTYLFKGDTMHSFHSSFGYPEYCGQAVKRTIYEYIFMYPYISGFSKVQSMNAETLQKIKGFFNRYHTLGNIVLTPAITVGRESINVHRNRYDKDNYYAYMDELFGKHDSVLDGLIQANSGFFSIVRNKEMYCDMLDISASEGPAYRRTREAAITAQDDTSIHNYIDVTQSIIQNRCDKMSSGLYHALQD